MDHYFHLKLQKKVIQFLQLTTMHHLYSVSVIFTKLMLLLLLPCCFLLSVRAVSSPIGQNETDRLALLAFKSHITSDPLEVLVSWNDSTNFCQWRGIRCSKRRPRVTALNLTSLELAGSIPPHIGNLSFLQVLLLSENNFIGEIPQAVGKLFRLKYLDLGINSFEGQIPGNISHCSNLLYLGLYSNKLIGEIPPQLGSLQRLQQLLIYNNSLTGTIPDSIGNMSSIQTLSASINYFWGSIPNTISQLKKLSYFSFGANNLSGAIPPSVYNLTSITLFSVPVNHLHGTLPPDLGLNSFQNLEKLNMHTNYFSGQIPRSIANASTLQVLAINDNQFTGDVPSFASLHNLEKLDLGTNSFGSGEDENLNFLPSLANCSLLQILNIDSCYFGGVLPESLSNFSSNLRILNVEGNQNLHGTIPDGIGNLINLVALGMSTNQFSGRIPSSFGRLKKLSELYLSDNKFSGMIPSSFGNMTSLAELAMRFNNLEGAIPSSFGRCKYLENLKLSHNNLSGTIPAEVMSISSLFGILDLSENRLTGSLPFEVGNLTSLSNMDVSGNKLSGELPSSLSSCTSLTSLIMNNNLFKGTIPQSLSSLRALDTLDMSSNNFSGQIPRFLETFVLLQYLNISNNDFEGEVPTKGVFTNKSIVSVTGNKRLCGGIAQLQLPKCSAEKSKKRRVSSTFKIVTPIIVGIIVLTLVASVSCWLFKRRKCQLSSSTSLFDDLVMRLSYENLLRATNGFASTNLLGRGSFGSVYKGVLEENETTIAVKVFDLQMGQAPKSFLAECEALRGIRHRNIVKVLSACSSIDFQGNDFKALVYEYMSNGSLEEWLHPVEDRPWELSFEKRLDIAIDVASALNYLHHFCHTPIVHCDLKPSNILMDSDMTACVGDFGLARFLSEDQSITVGLKGSIGYIAPEYVMGSGVSTYGDVYSYGILLLEMFTGNRPTDDMFNDSLSLGQLVTGALALPGRVTEIVDPILLVDPNTSQAMEECLVTILEIGVACSANSPRERPQISNVVVQMDGLRKALLGTKATKADLK